MVAVYRAQAARTIAAGASETVTCQLSTSLTDADGNDYDDRSMVYLCVQQGSERKVY